MLRLNRNLLTKLAQFICSIWWKLTIFCELSAAFLRFWLNPGLWCSDVWLPEQQPNTVCVCECVCAPPHAAGGPPLLWNLHHKQQPDPPGPAPHCGGSRPVSIRTLPPANPEFNGEGLARFRLVYREGAGPAPPNYPPCDEWHFQEATKKKVWGLGRWLFPRGSCDLTNLQVFFFFCSCEEIKIFFPRSIASPRWRSTSSPPYLLPSNRPVIHRALIKGSEQHSEPYFLFIVWPIPKLKSVCQLRGGGTAALFHSRPSHPARRVIYPLWATLFFFFFFLSPLLCCLFVL